MAGWIKLHRQFLEHWLYTKEKRPFTFREAWLDILLNVNFKQKKVNIGYDLFECGPGQILYSMKTWAERWKWSQSRVKRFLRLLEKDKMVSIKNLRKSTQITIINWESYQDDRFSSDSRSILDRSQDKKVKKVKKEDKGSVSKKLKRISSWNNSPTPMNCKQFVAKMLESPQRHVQIIGHLADEMKPGLETKGQWQVFFDRYKKEASILVPFTDDQLDYGCRKAIMNHPDIWTLETIKKEILKRKNGEK